MIDLLSEESEEFVLKQDRIRRSRRMLQKKNHITKQLLIRNGYNNCWSTSYELSPHRFHKMKSMNCGDSNCVMCGNPRKFWGERTIQEKRFIEGEQLCECSEYL